MTAVSKSQSRGYAGVDKLRRLLKKIDPEVVAGVRAKVEEGSQAIARDMRAGAPRDQGDLLNSISYKLSGDKLAAYIGPGADRANIIKHGLKTTKTTKAGSTSLLKTTKRGNLTSATIKDQNARFQLYKASWVEFGTKPHGSHPGTSARPFINPAFDANKNWLLNDMRVELDKALTRALTNV
jgi:HK97 gp10 family phage protein